MSSRLLARAVRIGLVLSLVAVVLGCRWAVIDRYGSDLPNWDQWDAEALYTLHPWFQHHLTLSLLLQPHNEHRIVLTKLLNLGLTQADGQWDQRLECVVNALLPAAIAVGWMALASSFLPRKWLAPLWLLIAVAYAAPLSWQNVIAGFHSQQFFLIGLSFAALAGLTMAEAWTAGWWLGAVSGVLALGSMASGFFAAPLAAMLLLCRRARGETTAALLPTLVLGAAVGAGGWLAKAPQPGHDVLRAHSAAEFLLSVLRSLQWPIVNHTAPFSRPAWVALALWLPWAWLVARMVRGAQPGARGRAGWVLVGLGAWTLLQIAATAYARGAGAEPPAPRYVDTLVIGALSNALALAWLAGEAAGTKRWALAAAGALWIGVFGCGIRAELEHNFGLELPAFRAFYLSAQRSVRDYLATGDPGSLRPGAVPYPSIPVLIDRLGLADVRAILPESVRRPVAIEAVAESAGFSAPGTSPATPPLADRRTWGSFAARNGVASWASVPVTAADGWLEFETAGQAGRPGVSIELRDPGSRRILAEVSPSRVPGDGWRAAYVRAPRGPFVVTAEVSES
ncbi:MAG TPA: hypothetical protein VHV47_05210, partial [Opitutaceae bacterium]|nr:hypothetical protein [Opitutaceae bacterium]